MLFFGATDPHGMTSRLLAALLAHSAPLAIDVLGGSSSNETLAALAAAHPRQVTLHAVVDDIASLMLAADLAAGAGGSTSWERCALGLPAAIAVTAPNQQLNAERLAAAGAAIVLGARRGGVLLPVLVLPLAVPVLIFGTAAADAAGLGLSARPHLLLLAAFFAASLPLCPVAAGAALRAALD